MQNQVGEYLFLRGCYTPATIAAILGISRTKVLQVLEDLPMPPILNRLSNRDRISWFESNLYMQNQLLKDTDTMSMYHGIEIRVPFLDHRMISNTLKIDPAVRFNTKLQKKLLIDAFADILPSEIWNRSKMGFTFPLQVWMKDAGIITNESLYPGTASKKLIKSFKKGKLHWSAAFALYLVHNPAASTPAQEVEQPIARNQPLKDLLWEPFYMMKTGKSLNYSLN
jgi:asparagine synthase (glutamine-hydrolysing)